MPRARVDAVIGALNASGPPHRVLDGTEWTIGRASPPQFAPGAAIRWDVVYSGPFRTRVVEDDEEWPAEERVDTEAGPLRVLAAAELTPADGVRDDVLDLWRAGRAAT